MTSCRNHKLHNIVTASPAFISNHMCICMFIGDPAQDMEYESQYREQYKQPRYIIPEVLKNFLTYFQKSIHEQNIYEIQNAYENG